MDSHMEKPEGICKGRLEAEQLNNPPPLLSFMIARDEELPSCILRPITLLPKEV
jgi:hypothetical protein